MVSAIESARRAYVNALNEATLAIFRGTHDQEMLVLVDVGEAPNLRTARDSTILHMRGAAIAEGLVSLS